MRQADVVREPAGVEVQVLVRHLGCGESDVRDERCASQVGQG
jgi:hypothetical protein